MKILLNILGFQYADSLIRVGKIDFGDTSVSPGPYDISSYISSKGFGAFSQWHLGQDEDIADNNTREKWQFCFTNDFYLVSRALIVKAQEAAQAAGNTDIETKCAELLAAIDVKQMSVMLAGAITAPALKSAATAAEKGWQWDVTVVQAGVTLTNPEFYIPVEALAASVDIFDGAKVYANSIADKAGHKSNRNEKVPGDVVAVLSKPYVEGDQLRALMTILPSAQWLRDNLLTLDGMSKVDAVYQLSVDSSVDAKRSFVASLNKTLPVVNRIVKSDVDIVGEAAAGGKINRLVASKDQKQSPSNNNPKGTTTMRQKLLSLLFFFPALLAGKTTEDWNKVEENGLYSHLLQAGKGFLPSSLPDGMTEQAVDRLCASYRENAQKILAAKMENGVLSLQAAKADPVTPVTGNKDVDDLKASLEQMKNTLNAQQKDQCANLLLSATDRLPVPLRDSIRKKFKDKIFTVAELQASIDEGKELIAPFMGPKVNNLGMDIKLGMEQGEKVQLALEGFFLTSNQRIKPMQMGSDEAKVLSGQTPFRSIKEAYAVITGDTDITGIAPKELRASLVTADWTNMISTAINKAMTRDYPLLNLETWRAIADVVPLKDFKQQQRLRYGGYGNLPTVAERGNYLPLTSPTDEKATYSPAKRGGTEDVTREMIKNDDVSAIQRIPTRMARAAAQTLHEFVYDFIRPAVNPTIYDGLALYHATHGNTGTAALDSTGLQAARLRMKKYAMKDNSKRLGIRAGFLIVPSDLEKTAYDLLTPAFNKNNTVPEFLQQIGVVPIVVDYWTDVTDWVLAAKREDVVGLEIGFIDGQETPQIFVSDIPNAGSFFTNDVMTMKIRHEYGGAIIDWRAFDGEIVAG